MGGAKNVGGNVDKGKEMLGNAVNKIRGKGQLNQSGRCCDHTFRWQYN